MEWLKSWLLSATCAAVVAAVANAVAPQGAPRKMVRLAGGLLLLLACLGPIKKLDDVEFSEILARYQGEYAGYEETLAQENEAMMKGIIEERTGAYILDKATALGLQGCSVSVVCQVEETGFPIPKAVTVRGAGEEGAWEQLRDAITADFAIEPENQTFERTDTP